MPRVNSFSIPAGNPERSIQFYEHVFGWRFEVLLEFEGPGGERMRTWRIDTKQGEEPGIDGWMGPREFAEQPIGVAMNVPSVDEFIGKVTEGGGTIVVGKCGLPGHGWFAVCKDPDGNTFVIFQADAAATLGKGGL